MRQSTMEHTGGCHCGNLRVTLRLTQPAADVRLRACGCSFCRGHATRTASDPNGSVDISAADWSQVAPYRFGTSTADFMVCRRCGIYIGAISESGHGTRAVINTNCLDSRGEFVQPPAPTNHDSETAEARVARRVANWTPAVIHR